MDLYFCLVHTSQRGFLRFHSKGKTALSLLVVPVFQDFKQTSKVVKLVASVL